MGGDVKRPYRSQRRREQAEQTRGRILDAAAELFLERGYDRTSISAVAAEAGVADETVYSHFGNKRSLVGALLERAARGADPRPILEQAGPREVAALPDQREQLRRFADDVSHRLERAAPLLAVIAAAAAGEPELAELHERVHAQRLHSMRSFVHAVAANGPLAARPDRATETIWALTSPELYRLLTSTRGWSRRRYASWLAQSLAALLLPGAAG